VLMSSRSKTRQGDEEDDTENRKPIVKYSHYIIIKKLKIFK